MISWLSQTGDHLVQSVTVAVAAEVVERLLHVDEVVHSAVDCQPRYTRSDNDIYRLNQR